MKLPMILPVLAIATALLACNNRREAVAAEATTTIETPATTESTEIQFGGTEKKDSLFLSFERTPCFGTCKAYRIEVYRSGSATYDGRSNMEKQGKHATRIDEGTMRLILARAEALGFFHMKDVYDGEVTDLPSTHMRIQANGRNKKVIGRVGQPAEFKQLAAYVEELLLPLPWKPVSVEP